MWDDNGGAGEAVTNRQAGTPAHVLRPWDRSCLVQGIHEGAETEGEGYGVQGQEGGGVQGTTVLAATHYWQLSWTGDIDCIHDIDCIQARSQDSGQEAYRGRPRQGQNRRNKFEQVDGWSVPRNSRSNSPKTIEKLQEMLSNANQHP